MPPEPFCGNDVVDPELGETCDGDAMPAMLCSELLLGTGMLGCRGPGTAAQCQYDTSGCENSADCGDGLITGAETCDGANFDGQTCEMLSEDYIGGELACDPVYCTTITDGCTPCVEAGDACMAGQCCNNMLCLNVCIGFGL